MANNARRSPNRNEERSNAAPRWVVFVGGLATGVIATVIVGALMWPRPGLPLADTDDGAPARDAQAQRADGMRKNEVEYVFEDLLSETEVPGPSSAQSVPTAVVPPTPEKPAAPTPEHSSLQAASFRTESDAETLRAQLLLLDLGPVYVKPALVNGVLWHRVMVGPFSTDTARRTAQSKLREQNLDALAVAAPADMAAPAPADKPASASSRLPATPRG